MTKEKIIDAVLNSKVLELYDKQDCLIYKAAIQEEIISVCSKGIIVMYFGEDRTCYYSLISFEEVSKIVILKEEVIE